MTLWNDNPEHDYDSYLDWFGEEPCANCVEDNAHCVCPLMDEMDTIPPPDDAELLSYWRRTWTTVSDARWNELE